MNKEGMNNKNKHVKPQVECHEINNPCLLSAGSENTRKAPDFDGQLN